MVFGVISALRPVGNKMALRLNLQVRRPFVHGRATQAPSLALSLSEAATERSFPAPVSPLGEKEMLLRPAAGVTDKI